LSRQREILVTGASRGIGLAICRKALNRGCRVIGVSRGIQESSLTDRHLTPVALNLADVDRLPAELRTLRKKFLGVDAIVCNAGFGRFGSLEQFSPGQIRELVDLNLTSQILLAREFIPALKARGSGDLIFMGSEAALSGGGKGAVYSATKFALRGLAQSLREECAGSGVRIGIINPGLVNTGFFDDLEFRPGDESDCHLTPEDVAGAVWLMLSARDGAVIDEINLSPRKRVIQFRKRSDNP